MIETNGIVIDLQGMIGIAAHEQIIARYSPEGQLLAHCQLDGLPTNLFTGPEGVLGVVLEAHLVQLFSPEPEPATRRHATG